MSADSPRDPATGSGTDGGAGSPDAPSATAADPRSSRWYDAE
ncbi:DUF742 domain-containing protein, partial [Streptomyces sp. ZEA17I]